MNRGQKFLSDWLVTDLSRELSFAVHKGKFDNAYLSITIFFNNLLLISYYKIILYYVNIKYRYWAGTHKNVNDSFENVYYYRKLKKKLLKVNDATLFTKHKVALSMQMRITSVSTQLPVESLFPKDLKGGKSEQCGLLK